MRETAYPSRNADSVCKHGDTGPRASGPAARLKTLGVVGGALAGLLVLTMAYLALPRTPDSMCLRALPFMLFFVFFGAIVTAPARMRVRGSGRPVARVDFTADGIAFGGRPSAPRIGWSAFTRFVETRTAFVLYSRSGLIHVVPKAGVADLERIRALRLVLRENVEGRGVAG